jgi:hypothetical protein
LSASIARYLKDFGEPASVLPEFMEAAPAFEADVAFFPEVIDEPIDVEAERADAFAKGEAEATAKMQARWDEDRATLIAEHEAALARLQAAHETALAEAVASKMQDIAVVVATGVSDQTAKVLAPLLEDALVAKAVADLADLVRDAVLEGAVGTLTVKGPAPLFEKLKASLDMPEAALRHVEATDLDLCVDVDEVALVTRMSAWTARLKELLA